MDRRTYLAGMLAGVAGCGGKRQSSPSTATDEPVPTSPPAATSAPTETPPGTATPVESGRTRLNSTDPYRTADGRVVRLTVFRARRGIVEAGDPHDTPLVPAARQFLQVGVETRGDGAPAPEDLCLTATVGDERPFDGCTARIEAVPPRRLGFLQAVPVPLPFDGERAAVVWDRPDAPNVGWRVSDRTVTALRNPPRFVVEGLSVPSSAADGETVPVDITVRNDGDRKDWFVAELGQARASDGADLEIPYDAGERRTVTREFTVRFGDADEAVVRLDWDLDAVEKRVARA